MCLPPPSRVGGDLYQWPFSMKMKYNGGDGCIESHPRGSVGVKVCDFGNKQQHGRASHDSPSYQPTREKEAFYESMCTPRWWRKTEGGGESFVECRTIARCPF